MSCDGRPPAPSTFTAKPSRWVVITALFPAADDSHSGRAGKDLTMEYRTLGRSGCAVSALALGTMTFGSEADEEASHAQLDVFVEAGGTLIDTADVYTSGVSEEIIGRWLAKQPADVRSQVVLATKGRMPMGDGPNDAGLSRRHLSDALDASLRRLGVESVDLYQVHAFDPLTPLDETLGFLDDAVRAGKISYVGLSNYTGWQVQKVVDLAEFRGLARPVTLQPQYSLLVREIEWEIVPGLRIHRAGAAPVVAARRRVADRQVHPRCATDRRHAARRGPGARHGGLRPPQHQPAHVGRRSMRSSRWPRRAESAWRRWRSRGWSTGRW